MIAFKEDFIAKCAQASCRSCRRLGLLPVLDLGSMPLSDGLVLDQQASEEFFPLEMAFCPECSLVQILKTVPPEKLFAADYPYYSSFSDALLEHSRQNVLNLIATRKLGPQSLVVELASNDGYLLKNFIQAGIPALGIDPAPGPARAAEKAGVPTLNTFFTLELAGKLVDEGRRADVIIANNVLAHVADTNGFVKGIAMLLRDDGQVVIEVPYLRDLIDHCEFDTVYHEHLCYFSLLALDKLFRSHGLSLNDVERLAIHGGSLRLYVGKTAAATPAVTAMLEEEKLLGMDKHQYYTDFSRQVLCLRQELRRLLMMLKARKKSIAAYGAAAKGTILLNYIRAGRDVIDFVVDRNVHKQGKYMPGVHIPIQAPETLTQQMPDYVLVLPWNFKTEILSQQAEYRRRGGKFIIPIPKPEIT